MSFRHRGRRHSCEAYRAGRNACAFRCVGSDALRRRCRRRLPAGLAPGPGVRRAVLVRECLPGEMGVERIALLQDEPLASRFCRLVEPVELRAGLGVDDVEIPVARARRMGGYHRHVMAVVVHDPEHEVGALDPHWRCSNSLRGSSSSREAGTTIHGKVAAEWRDTRPPRARSARAGRTVLEQGHVADPGELDVIDVEQVDDLAVRVGHGQRGHRRAEARVRRF